NFIHVMQRSVTDGDAADLHRLQPCYRRDRAGATNLPLDITQYGDLFLRRKLVRDGPTRCARNKSELLLPIKAIDLVDHAVDVIAELVAPQQNILVERLQRLDTGATFYFAVDAQAELAQPLQAVEMGRRLDVRLAARHAVGIKLQRPLGGDARVQLAQATGGGITRVGKLFLPCFKLARIQRFETRL